MDVPGQIGWSVSGDKTYEFARTPLDFITSRIEKYNSKVFKSRALNKPTIFVTSNSGVKDILIDRSSSFTQGYKDFGYMHALYGDLFLFEDDETAFKVRNLVKELFHKKNCDEYMNKIKSITDEKLCDLHTRSTVDVYEIFKDLSTAVCLSIFLDVDSMTEYHTLKSVARMHWHGLISVPVSVKVKGWSSSYSKAEEAKSFLLERILDKLQTDNHKGRFLQCIDETGFRDSNEAATHVLLFISSIIPKALSSLLTSFVIEMAGDFKENAREKTMENETFLDDVLLEVERLWPPLYGGRRFAKESVIVDGYHIPADHCVAYISRFANRDSEVFQQPDQFLPERWQGSDRDKKHLVWTYGAGVRGCIGVYLIHSIIKHVATYITSRFDWSVIGDVVPVYKTLPVARPKDPVQILFSSKCDDE